MTDQTTTPVPGRATSPRRGGLVPVVASVAAVVLIAAGGLVGWRAFFASGPRPAEVLPATTFAVVSVDLDPSAGQKLEAVKTLRKFPTVKSDDRVRPDADLVRSIVEEVVATGGCDGVDYERDVKPWIGHRAAFGGVDLGAGPPAPVFALQVNDAQRARSGFSKLLDCAEQDSGLHELGWTVSQDYLVASDTSAHAKAILAAGRTAPLAEDAAYQKWTREAGGDGIATVYVAAKAATVLHDQLGSVFDGLGGATKASGTQDQAEQLSASLKSFRGAAAVLRFAGGGIELSFAGGGARRPRPATVADHAGHLPADTAAVIAAAVPTKALAQLAAPDGPGAGLTEGTGLTLPDDLVALLGSSISLSVGGHAPSHVDSPEDVPVGALVHGDDTRVRAVIGKVESALGIRLSDLSARLASKDGRVAVASSSAYADQLLADGSLAESRTFRDVVPHAKDASALAYVSLDNGWLALIRDQARQSGDRDTTRAVADLAAVKAFGASAWTQEDGISRALVRLSLK